MTTIPQEPYAAADPHPEYTERVRRPGRGLAGAIATFLGGYLVLASTTGQLTQVLMGVLTPDRAPMFDASISAYLVLQFAFGLLVTAGGILLGSRRTGLGMAGAAIAVVAPVVVVFIQAARLSGAFRFPGDAAVIQSLFGNPWWTIVLWIGIGWLLARGARLGWLALLGALVLIPIPTALTFADVPSGVVLVVMFLLSGIVGAAIIAGGRPLRD